MLNDLSTGRGSDFVTDVQTTVRGKLPNANDGSIDSAQVAFTSFKKILDEGVAAGQFSSSPIVSTFSLAFAGAYQGGVLAPNGDIHFVPAGTNRGQKISASGVGSTYSLVYTAGDAYNGGVLAPNGYIHFVPYAAPVGQKVSASGVVSTYSLVYTSNSTYAGGILAPNGDIYFIPYLGNRGQKISTNTGVKFSQGICQHPFFNKF